MFRCLQKIQWKTTMITIINGNAADYSYSADMIFTDPPFDMSGKELHGIISNYDADHLLLVTVCRQYTEFCKLTNYEFALDFVFDTVVPSKSHSRKQPHSCHNLVIYMRKKGVKTAFDRMLYRRRDVATKGYYPTIFRAPRDRLTEYGYAKNLQAITDLLGSFNVKSVIDPFAGTGTVAHACLELSRDCISIEQKEELTDQLYKEMHFIGGKKCQYLNREK